MANGITYGLHFPFLKSPVGLYVRATDTTDEEIKSDLLHLLLTRRGTRYYLPDFGTRLYEFIFEPLDAQTFNSMKDEIYEQVKTYIPNLTITNITLRPRPRLVMLMLNYWVRLTFTDYLVQTRQTIPQK